MKINFKKGFTLIELLVVIAIIGLLSSVVLASLGTARDKAKNAKIQQELLQIKNAIELTRGSDGSYPLNLNLNNSIKFSLIGDTDLSKIVIDLKIVNGGQTFVGYADGSPVTKYSLYSAILPVGTTYRCIDSDGNITTGPVTSLATPSLVDGGYCR